MSHIRKQIRAELITELTGLTTTGNNVFDTQYFAIEAASLPCLRIFQDGDTEEIELDTRTTLLRHGSFIVEAIVQAVSGAEDVVDTICAEVETAIDRTLGGLVLDCYLSRVMIGRIGDGDSENVAARLVFACMYRTAVNAPESSV